MNCPYCNKELGEKNECITPNCYAFGKIFPNYDVEKESDGQFTSSDSSQSKEKDVKVEDVTHNSDIDAKLEEIKKNAKLEQNTFEDNYLGESSNAGLYFFLAIIILFIIGFSFF